jgi:hypothetical protein
MAATLGHITVTLLAKTPGGEAVEIGTIDLPVEVKHGPVGLGRIVVDPAQIRASLAAGLAQASVEIQ